MTLVFVDVETTSLRADRRAWEVALIVRKDGQPDAEYEWLITDVSLAAADPFSLKVGGFWDRHPRGTGQFDGPAAGGMIFWNHAQARGHRLQMESSVARYVDQLTRDGATLVGACPWFDEQTLDDMLRRHGHLPRWDYRLRDVSSAAAGFLGRDVGGLRSCADALGVEYVEADLHTALGDARLARDIWDRVTAPRPGPGYTRVVGGVTG